MKILFLDDKQERHRRFMQEHIGCSVVQVYTAREAIEQLEASRQRGEAWDVISLDHDLTEAHELACIRGLPLPPAGDGSGYDVALWMAEHKVAARAVVLHSFNQAGAERMARVLRMRYRPYRLPFGTPRPELFQQEVPR